MKSKLERIQFTSSAWHHHKWMFMVLPFENSSLNTLHSQSSLTNTPSWHQNKCKLSKLFWPYLNFLIIESRKKILYIQTEQRGCTMNYSYFNLGMQIESEINSSACTIDICLVHFTFMVFFSSLTKPAWQGLELSSMWVFAYAPPIDNNGHDENVNYSIWKSK